MEPRQFKITIKGNDVFVYEHQSRDHFTFAGAAMEAVEVLENLEGNTIEALRIASIEEIL